ncbi:MAG TPA: single-stranded DNA-binding protein [Firmicutes bacterium]|nr:single-stranded DNA-binding protein [Bacillota bacterium]
MINRIVLVGRLVRDPELRFTASGKAVGSFTLAVNRPFLNQQGERDADFINIVTWEKTAETCANYLKKGSQVALEGRLQIRPYDDSQGIRRKAAEVVANNVMFLDRARRSELDESEDSNLSGDLSVSEDDIPF